jgi:hypothetical protein
MPGDISCKSFPLKIIYKVRDFIGVLVQTINPEAATGRLASRYAPERYKEFVAE